MRGSGPLSERSGDVEVWWVDRPAGPRTHMIAAAKAGALLVVLLAGALVWTRMRGEPLWPWQTVVPLSPSGPLLAVRYLSIAGVGLLYIVARSAPAWIRLHRLIRSDAAAIPLLIARGQWSEAAWRLHRCTHLAQEVYGPKGPAASIMEMDERIRPEMAPARRLYVHYHGRRPDGPPSPESGFTPRVVPVRVAGGWWTLPMVLVLGVAVFADLGAALRSGHYRDLAGFNFILASAIVLAYVVAHLLALMGWRSYFRFAPGVAQLLTYRVWRRQPRTETIHLRDCDVIMNITSPHIVLTLIDRRTHACTHTYQLRNNTENLDACLRAVLSVAAVRTLSGEQLVE